MERPPFPLEEPLLTEDPSRVSIFPIKYLDIWEMYKKGVASFWVPEEVDMQQDITDWKTKMKKNDKFFIKRILEFFYTSEDKVIENLGTTMMQEVHLPEASYFYMLQLQMEAIHAEMYAISIDTLIEDEKEKQDIFAGAGRLPGLKKKLAWAEKWIASDKSFAHKMIAFAVVEGIFFSGAFCSLFWLKKQGKMPGLTFSNELISRDEGLHCDFACLLYTRHTSNKLPAMELTEIVTDAVEAEIEFCTESLPVDLIGMNKNLMKEYIKFVADRLLTSLGVPKVYHAKNPFPFMEMISLQGKTNFFERRVSEYKKAGVMESKSTDAGKNSFTLDETF
ncbi:MAG: ribonucleotide-diphosphate reductase subunit beta [Cytophagales bacterium]